MPTDGRAVPRIGLPSEAEISIQRLYSWDRSAIRGDIPFVNTSRIAIIREGRMIQEPVLLHRINLWLSRRELLRRSAVAVAGLSGAALAVPQASANGAVAPPAVQTVLGPVAPDKLGATLMHEHAPIVDWSELYETP